MTPESTTRLRRTSSHCGSHLCTAVYDWQSSLGLTGAILNACKITRSQPRTNGRQESLTKVRNLNMGGPGASTYFAADDLMARFGSRCSSSRVLSRRNGAHPRNEFGSSARLPAPIFGVVSRPFAPLDMYTRSEISGTQGQAKLTEISIGGMGALLIVRGVLVHVGNRPRAALGTDPSGLAMELAGKVEHSAARARRERRLRHEARVRLTLVRDGVRLAGHRGGPELREHRAAAEPAMADVVAALRQELTELPDEVAFLRAKFQHQQGVQEVQVPVAMNLEEAVVVPKVMQQESVQHQPVEHAERERGHIRLKVVDQLEEWKVTVLKAESLCKLKDEYCRRQGLQASQVRFRVFGKLVTAGSTAEELGLKDKDIIDASIVKGTSVGVLQWAND